MGEVLQARDLKLNRLVALKVLRADQRADEEKRRRFFNEAQAASALNHPNIVTIYDVVNEGEHDYLVMEYVAGKTLGEILSSGPLRFKEVLQYGVQIADAFAAAHAAGIVHRDLKPANVMVTERGRVKVLDFGLAKLEAPLEDPADPDATQLTPMTREGFIVGTCAYMSPEQAQGKPVDARSDIFSFGAVLYEMATGKRAFSGDNNITTLSAVLRDEPRSLLEISPNIPGVLERLIHRCLRKEVGERWQSMEEVRAALAALKQSADSGILHETVVTNVAPAAPAEAPRPEPSPFAAPPPQPNKSGHHWAEHLKNPWVLVAIAAAAAAVFSPRSSRVERSPKVAVETVRDSVKEAMDNVAQELDTDSEQLDNDDIVRMVKEKVPESVIIGQIQTSRPNFALGSDDVIALVKEGVPEKVIEAMRNPRGLMLPPGAGPLIPIPDGTAIRLALAADVAKDLRPGTPLAFTVDEELRVGEALLIPKGAPARGVVAPRSRRGRIYFELLDVDAMGGVKLRLRALPELDKERKWRLLDFGDGKSDDLVAKAGTPLFGYADGQQALPGPPGKAGSPKGEKKGPPPPRPPAPPATR